MGSISKVPFPERTARYRHLVAKRLFTITEAKKSNLVISVDLIDSKSLFAYADSLGPFIAVFKTHVDLISDFGDATIHGLKDLVKKHNFIIFEDYNLVDIDNTVQNRGDGIVKVLDQTVISPDFSFLDQRAFLLLAEMTSKGSLATGVYTQIYIDPARQFPRSMIDLVATKSLVEENSVGGEDFVVFTTGVNLASKGDKLGQQYQIPASAMEYGADFIITGRGIYTSTDPVEAAKSYQTEGWVPNMKRTQERGRQSHLL